MVIEMLHACIRITLRVDIAITIQEVNLLMLSYPWSARLFTGRPSRSIRMEMEAIKQVGQILNIWTSTPHTNHLTRTLRSFLKSVKVGLSAGYGVRSIMARALLSTSLWHVTGAPLVLQSAFSDCAAVN
jgi:hypothetical protein